MVLAAAAALLSIQGHGAQDTSRLCFSRALLSGHLSADACLRNSVDHATFGGHLYSDKAPGMSVLELPWVALVRLPTEGDWHAADVRIWVVRLLTSGIAFLACAFLVGRISEGVAPGWGAASLVTFALGTLVSSLAGSTFEEVPAAALGFAAFVLAWRRNPFAAGLLAGLAFLTAYQVAVIGLIVGAYVVLGGLRAAVLYVAGIIPFGLMLGAYNWLAFDSPFHLSYRYNAPAFRSQQQQGLFGIHLPNLHATKLVLVGDRGLLVSAPVLVIAVLGLVTLARRGYTAEALCCGLVTVAFLVIEFGYFDPYGGESPGPRFFIPAIPFLALGFAPAFATRRLLATALASVSVFASTVVALTWPGFAHRGYGGTVWHQIALTIRHGASAGVGNEAPSDILHFAGMKNSLSALLLVGLSLLALGIALYDGWSARTAAG
jgi:hypothetical protein